MHTHTHTHAHMHTHTHTHMHMHTHTHMHMHTHTHTHTYTYTHMHTHIHMHTYTHTHMHTRTHAHAHTHKCQSVSNQIHSVFPRGNYSVNRSVADPAAGWEVEGYEKREIYAAAFGSHLFYHLQTKLRKGNVFTPVCQSFCPQEGMSPPVHAWIHSPLCRHSPNLGRHVPLGRHPLGRPRICDYRYMVFCT